MTEASGAPSGEQPLGYTADQIRSMEAEIDRLTAEVAKGKGSLGEKEKEPEPEK